MTTYGVTLDVTLHQPLDDQRAAQLAREWARRTALTLVGSTLDGRRLTLDAVGDLGDEPTFALDHVLDDLRDLVDVAHLRAAEIRDSDEIHARATTSTIPPLVDAAALAELCDVHRSRVYQWAGERPAGFPDPVVPGYWLRAAAEHWAATRPTKPGPRPATTEGVAT